MGAKSYWGVKVWTAISGTSYDVPNVQSISFSYGRTQPTDDFPAAQATVTGILPDDLPALFKEVNSIVSFDLYDLDGNRRARYWVRVKNLTRTYGTIENLDTWQMTGVGWIAQLTEQQLTSDYSTTAGWDTGRQASNLLDAYSITNIYSTGSSLVSGTTFTVGTYISDIVQEIIRTEQGRIIDCYTATITLTSRSDAVSQGSTATFSDDSTMTTAYRYTSVDFLNTGDYLANTVVVEPEGLAAVSIGTTRPVLSFQTVDQTSAQGSDLAGYIKNTLNLNTVRPASITYLVDAQTVTPLPLPPRPGNQIEVVLRGTTYNCVIEGVEVVASPSVTTVTLNLSSAEAYRFLRLDDATFGILDYNRLGF